MMDKDEVMDILHDHVQSEGLEYTLVDYHDWREVAEINPDLMLMILEYQAIHAKVMRYLKVNLGWDV